MNQLATAASLRFPDLFTIAASAWPAELPLMRLEAANGGYLVDGLDTDAADAFVGAPDAVLMLNVFDATYEALHAWAADHASARPPEMAAEVRPRFERRLRAIEADPGFGDWRDQDVALIRRYFEANAEAA